MDKVNGVSEMKAQYQTARDQKIKDKHFSFIRFFQNTSAFGYRIYLAIIIAIIALLGIIRLITDLIRRQREKKNEYQLKKQRGILNLYDRRGMT